MKNKELSRIKNSKHSSVQSFSALELNNSLKRVNESIMLSEDSFRNSIIQSDVNSMKEQISEKFKEMNELSKHQQDLQIRQIKKKYVSSIITQNSRHYDIILEKERILEVTKCFESIVLSKKTQKQTIQKEVERLRQFNKNVDVLNLFLPDFSFVHEIHKCQKKETELTEDITDFEQKIEKLSLSIEKAYQKGDAKNEEDYFNIFLELCIEFEKNLQEIKEKLIKSKSITIEELKQYKSELSKLFKKIDGKIMQLKPTEKKKREIKKIVKYYSQTFSHFVDFYSSIFEDTLENEEKTISIPPKERLSSIITSVSVIRSKASEIYTCLIRKNKMLQIVQRLSKSNKEIPLKSIEELFEVTLLINKMIVTAESHKENDIVKKYELLFSDEQFKDMGKIKRDHMGIKINNYIEIIELVKGIDTTQKNTNEFLLTQLKNNEQPTQTNEQRTKVLYDIKSEIEKLTKKKEAMTIFNPPQPQDNTQSTKTENPTHQTSSNRNIIISLIDEDISKKLSNMKNVLLFQKHFARSKAITKRYHKLKKHYSALQLEINKLQNQFDHMMNLIYLDALKATTRVIQRKVKKIVNKSKNLLTKLRDISLIRITNTNEQNGEIVEFFKDFSNETNIMIDFFKEIISDNQTYFVVKEVVIDDSETNNSPIMNINPIVEQLKKEKKKQRRKSGIFKILKELTSTTSKGESMEALGFSHPSGSGHKNDHVIIYFGKMNWESLKYGAGKEFYWPSGKLLFFGEFYDDLRNGFGKEYSNDGTLIREGIYKYGMFSESNLDIGSYTLKEDVNLKKLLKKSKKVLISRGATGKIYKIQNTDFVFKKINLNILSADEFMSECKILAQLNHPNVVKFQSIIYKKESTSSNRGGGNMIINMNKKRKTDDEVEEGGGGGVGKEKIPEGLICEYCQNGAVSDLIKRYNMKNLRMRFDFKCRIIYEVSNGMKYLHQKKIVHYDLKWQNTLLSKINQIKIIDFGLSQKMKIMTEDGNNSDNNVRGTKFFVSPEILRRGKVCEKTDVFSFGIMLFNLLVETDNPYHRNTSEDFKNGVSIDQLVCNDPSFRPKIEDFDEFMRIKKDEWNWWLDLQKRCWDHSPSKRPSFEEIEQIIFDNMPKKSVMGSL